MPRAVHTDYEASFPACSIPDSDSNFGQKPEMITRPIAIRSPFSATRPNRLFGAIDCWLPDLSLARDRDCILEPLKNGRRARRKSQLRARRAFAIRGIRPALLPYRFGLK